MVDNATLCTGLDFSKYRRVGLDIQEYTALTYDATMMLLLALDLAVNAGMANPTAEQLTNLLIQNLSNFQGLASFGFRIRINDFSIIWFWINIFRGKRSNYIF